MPTLHLVKVFSEKWEAGNLAGVVTDAETLSDEQMQAIATSLRASETAFIFPSEHADIKIRWFSPKNEVGICVHATIAALGVLVNSLSYSFSTITVETKNAILLCNVRDGKIFVQISDYQIKDDKVDISNILALLPLERDDIVGQPKIIQIFDDFELIIELKSFQDLSKLKPSQDTYSKICNILKVTGFSIFTKDRSDQIHTREFAPLYLDALDGEDPLCGMAAGAIYKYLGSSQSLNIEQGYFCGTSGIINVGTEGNNIVIGGNYIINSLTQEITPSENYVFSNLSQPHQLTRNQRGYMHPISSLSNKFIRFSASCNKPVIDMGCAYGNTVKAALDEGAKQVIACDMEKEHLSVLNATISVEQKTRLTSLVGQFPQDFNFEEASISAIHASLLLPYLNGDEIKIGLKKFYDWLEPNGKVFILLYSIYIKEFINDAFQNEYAKRVHADEEWPGYFIDFTAFSADTDPTDRSAVPNTLHFIDLPVLVKAIKKVGFSIEEAEYIDGKKNGAVKETWHDGREYINLIARK